MLQSFLFLFKLMMLKRAPFNGMRGRRAPFIGMRGRRAPFTGMRGKKDEYDGELYTQVDLF